MHKNNGLKTVTPGGAGYVHRAGWVGGVGECGMEEMLKLGSMLVGVVDRDTHRSDGLVGVGLRESE